MGRMKDLRGSVPEDEEGGAGAQVPGPGLQQAGAEESESDEPGPEGLLLGGWSQAYGLLVASV